MHCLTENPFVSAIFMGIGGFAPLRMRQLLRLSSELIVLSNHPLILVRNRTFLVVMEVRETLWAYIIVNLIDRSSLWRLFFEFFLFRLLRWCYWNILWVRSALSCYLNFAIAFVTIFVIRHWMLIKSEFQHSRSSSLTGARKSSQSDRQLCIDNRKIPFERARRPIYYWAFWNVLNFILSFPERISIYNSEQLIKLQNMHIETNRIN